MIFPPFACMFSNNMKEANLWALKQVREHADRFLPSGTLFPLAPDAIEMLRLLNGEGVRLINIHPSIDLHDVADPAARPFYAEAESLGMILDYHTGPHGTRLSLARPEKFDDIAWDFPKLGLVLEHLGGRAYYEQMLAIIASHRRRKEVARAGVYGGLTSILDNRQPTQKLWHLGPEKVREAIEMIGADYFIFGIDFPWNDMKETRRAIEILRGLDLPETDKAKIMGGNLARILGLDN